MSELTISANGAAFLAAHEGFASKAYRCPAGVITIGFGFTMGSKVFAEFWRRKHGRALRMGDRIGRSEAEILLRSMFDGEYGAAVNSEIRPVEQHHYDGAGSVAFNCGPGSLKWKWAQALAGRRVDESARLLRTTAITANGRRLAGLVRRRDEEAKLIETGRYTGVGAIVSPQTQPSVSRTADEIREYQAQLLKLGYRQLGTVDGVAGKKTRAAIRAFQKANGLEVDGIVGPATRAALVRALDAKLTVQASSGAGGAGAMAGALPTDVFAQTGDAILSTLAWGIGAAAVIAFVSLAFRHRGRITGRRVPT